MLRFSTAGESHGSALVAILEGIPAGLALSAEQVNAQLARRQQGHGRGRRMQIEQDTVELLSGVRAGETIGSPIAMLIRNRDWKNWADVMDPALRESDVARSGPHVIPSASDVIPSDSHVIPSASDVIPSDSHVIPSVSEGSAPPSASDVIPSVSRNVIPSASEGSAPASASEGSARVPRKRALTRVRPGHADMAGLMKYDRADARDILERASARETAARVAVGAVCRVFLERFGVRIGSHVVALGGIAARVPDPLPDDLNAAADASPVRTLDPDAEARMIARIDETRRAGNTLGGVCEVVATGVCVGLGSHTAWDRRLDGRLGQAMMSIPAVKGVEIGMGFAAAGVPGSEVHDEVDPDAARIAAGGVRRRSNRAGGLEGGMTTGEPLVARVAMKPISTLMKPLDTIDVATGASAQAAAERSDVTAVPAMGVIAEAMMAIVLAEAMLEKFGGDSLGEVRRNHDGYLSQLDHRIRARSG